MVDHPTFDPQVGLPAADMESLMALTAKVGEAYLDVLKDFLEYNQEWDEVKGVWRNSRSNFLNAGFYFDGIDEEDGSGIFINDGDDHASIPADFITTPRAQWVAAWEAKRKAKIDEFCFGVAGALEAAAVLTGQQAEREAQEMSRLEADVDALLAVAITHPWEVTPRIVDKNGTSIESWINWQTRAVRTVMTQSSTSGATQEEND